MIDDPIVNPPQSRSKKEIESTKDSYLVDVDVDVDGVMMDGLDQVEYLKRNVANSSNARFYMNLDDYNMLLTDEELAEIYEAEKGTRFTTETISRTLEALALEGLTDL